MGLGHVLHTIMVFNGCCMVESGCSAALPLQLTVEQAPRYHGVHSHMVASKTEGLFVEHSSLQHPSSIFLTRMVCCVATVTI